MVNSILKIIHNLKLRNLKYQITTILNFLVTVAQLNEQNKNLKQQSQTLETIMGSRDVKKLLEDDVHDDLQLHDCHSHAVVILCWKRAKEVWVLTAEWL